MSPTGNDDILQRIETKLEQMLKLAALQMTANMKQSQAIQMLNTAGFDRRFISDLLGTTPNTVSVTVAKAKARQRPREISTVDTATLVPPTKE